MQDDAAQRAPGDIATLLRPEPYAELFKSTTLLAAEKRQQGQWNCFSESVRKVRETSTHVLILRLHTASDPLMLWVIHLELDRREVPPCLRWPCNDSRPQAEFITWLADMLWFARHHPGHRAAHRGWRDMLAQAPGTAKWHAHAGRQYGYAETHRGQRSLAQWCTQGLVLTDIQRLELMTLPTSAMQASRRAIKGDRWTALNEALLSYAMNRPDRSGERSPEDIATRRALLYRTHVLAGRSTTRAARYWALLTGQAPTRQAVAKQIAAVEAIVGP